MGITIGVDVSDRFTEAYAIDGLRGEEGIASLCRREGIAAN
jgi:hypothetical protein